MCIVNDGGPAFPALYPVEDEAGRLGISLRDWFAGRALTADAKWFLCPENVVKTSFMLADLMIKKRG